MRHSGVYLKEKTGQIKYASWCSKNPVKPNVIGVVIPPIHAEIASVDRRRSVRISGLDGASTRPVSGRGC